VHPNFLHINSLKPDVIYGVKKVKNKPAYVADLIKNYSYNEDGNKKLKAYLQDLDNKRNTDSKRVLPWCWA
jgi:lipopolysaccharide export system protein LptC